MCRKMSAFCSPSPSVFEIMIVMCSVFSCKVATRRNDPEKVVAVFQRTI